MPSLLETIKRRLLQGADAHELYPAMEPQDHRVVSVQSTAVTVSYIITLTAHSTSTARLSKRAGHYHQAKLDICRNAQRVWLVFDIVQITWQALLSRLKQSAHQRLLVATTVSVPTVTDEALRSSTGCCTSATSSCGTQDES